MLGFETNLAKPERWNAAYRLWNEANELELIGLGNLESCVIPTVLGYVILLYKNLSNRIGYLFVEIASSEKSATLIGFLPAFHPETTDAEVAIATLQSMDDLIDYLTLTQEFAEKKITYLRNWLNREKITQKDEVQIIVQTEDRQLRGLPWQEWDTLAGYTSKGVEVAISATNFQRLTQKQTPQLKATARILVVFGDEKLGFAEEEDFIKSLRQHGGEPHILRQLTRQELEQKLKDSQGWHIFFFAGHSQSDRDGRIGRIQK